MKMKIKCWSLKAPDNAATRRLNSCVAPCGDRQRNTTAHNGRWQQAQGARLAEQSHAEKRALRRRRVCFFLWRVLWGVPFLLLSQPIAAPPRAQPATGQQGPFWASCCTSHEAASRGQCHGVNRTSHRLST